MSQDNGNRPDVSAIFGPFAFNVRAIITIASRIDPDEFDAVAKTMKGRISEATVMGPLMDPSAWLDGTRFENAELYTRIFDLLSPIIREANKIAVAKGGAS